MKVSKEEFKRIPDSKYLIQDNIVPQKKKKLSKEKYLTD